MKNGWFTTIWNKKCSVPLLTSPKANLLPKKARLCIWRNWEGFCVLRAPSVQFRNFETVLVRIYSGKYCFQINRLKALIDEKYIDLSNQMNVIFQKDNTTPHVSMQTRQRLLYLDWGIRLHSPYSPDLATWDCYLFRPLKNYFNGTNFNVLEACKNCLGQFITQKDVNF